MLLIRPNTPNSEQSDFSGPNFFAPYSGSGLPCGYQLFVVTCCNSIQHKFLTPEEAAELLGGLNPRTVTRWAREGYIPAYPMGEGKRRLWRFRAEEIERWLISRRQATFADRLPEKRSDVKMISAIGALKGRYEST